MRNCFACLFGGILAVSPTASAVPLLCFSDLASGPKTGNSDVSLGQTAGADGAIVTVWGKNLGASQGTSKVFVNGVEARVYSWKNATTPADLFSRHKMQMIEFQVSGLTPDNGAGITVSVNAETSNALPFTIRSAFIAREYLFALMFAIGDLCQQGLLQESMYFEPIQISLCFF